MGKSSLNFMKLQLGNIHTKKGPIKTKWVPLLEKADVLEVHGTYDQIKDLKSQFKNQDFRHVSALAGFDKPSFSLETVEKALIKEISLSKTCYETVVLNEFSRHFHKMKDPINFFNTSYEIAQKYLNTSLTIRDIGCDLESWTNLLKILKDSNFKKLVDVVEIQVRSDLGWPSRYPINQSFVNDRLGWHIKKSRYFRAFKISKLKELIKVIKEIGYKVRLVELTCWVGSNPTKTLIKAQEKLYLDWISLGEEVSFWDWHDYLALNDFPGLWRTDGSERFPSVIRQLNG